MRFIIDPSAGTVSFKNRVMPFAMPQTLNDGRICILEQWSLNNLPVGIIVELRGKYTTRRTGIRFYGRYPYVLDLRRGKKMFLPGGIAEELRRQLSSAVIHILPKAKLEVEPTEDVEVVANGEVRRQKDYNGQQVYTIGSATWAIAHRLNKVLGVYIRPHIVDCESDQSALLTTLEHIRS
jgi:hypothetical protein